jgi:hypothetical protein
MNKTRRLVYLLCIFISCNNGEVNRLQNSESRVIQLSFSEEFGYDPITILNGEDTIFSAPYIAFYPLLLGTSLEQDATINFKVYLPSYKTPISVVIGDQKEVITMKSNETTLFVLQKVALDSDNNHIIDTTKTHWPFYLLCH